jgi:hypothetical protein
MTVFYTTTLRSTDMALGFSGQVTTHERRFARWGD